MCTAHPRLYFTYFIQGLLRPFCYVYTRLQNVTDWSIMADSQSSKHCIKYGKFNWIFVKPWLQGTIFQITKFQTNSNVVTVFEYIHHYGPVILLLCMTTSKTGLYQISIISLLSFFLIQNFPLCNHYVTIIIDNVWVAVFLKFFGCIKIKFRRKSKIAFSLAVKIFKR